MVFMLQSNHGDGFKFNQSAWKNFNIHAEILHWKDNASIWGTWLIISG